MKKKIIYGFIINAILGIILGTITYLIKEKITNKRVTNNIPKLNCICMTLSLIIGIGMIIYELWKNVFVIQPVYLIGVLSISGFILGTILGIIENKRKIKNCKL